MSDVSSLFSVNMQPSELGTVNMMLKLVSDQTRLIFVLNLKKILVWFLRSVAEKNLPVH